MLLVIGIVLACGAVVTGWLWFMAMASQSNPGDANIPFWPVWAPAVGAALCFVGWANGW